ncbi:MAG TPA: DUF1707 and DUF4190 domain-containing protein [Streptosporangiaceae bacterium]|jgi:hypothetical protein
MAAHGRLRCSSADRERAVDVLKAAFSEGRLTSEEFEERTGQVYRSKTYAELASLTCDLPVGPLGTLTPPPAALHPAAMPPGYPPYPGRRPVNSLAVAALVCSLIPGVPMLGGLAAGVVARRQIAVTGERGAGLATAAITIGTLGLVLMVAYVLLVVSY